MAYFFCYNKDMTKLIKNVFNQEDIITLYRNLACFSGEGHKIKETGRYIIASTQLDRIPGIMDVISKIETMATEYAGKPMKMATVGYHLYKKCFGLPFLPPHIDEYAGEVVFDYQLDSTISWPIKINKELYVLENNDAIMFNGESVPHSRPESNFIEFEHVLMFIVNLISEDHWNNFFVVNPKDQDTISNEIKQIREDEENW